MSNIIIGSARISENGSVYGEAGDQTQVETPDYSGEVSMQEFYVHSKGWIILRPFSVEVANRMAKGMITACNNENVGYSQSGDSKSGRYGVVNYGIETTEPVGADCSSLVRADAKEATGKDPGDFTTATEKDTLCSSSYAYFENVGDYISQSKTPIYNGDALVTKTKGHTVVVCSGNPWSSDTASSGASSKSTKEELEVDGEIGQLTTIRWQQFLGQTGNNVDGKIDGQPSASKKYWTSILSSVCKWSGGTSPMAKKWQQYLINAGYSCGSAGADGKFGKDTAKASQKFLIAKGYSCGSSGVDGIFGKNSAKALQKFLNASA